MIAMATTAGSWVRIAPQSADQSSVTTPRSAMRPSGNGPRRSPREIPSARSMPVTAAAMWNPTNPTAITASDIEGDASLRPSQARTSPNSTPGTTKKASSLP